MANDYQLMRETGAKGVRETIVAGMDPHAIPADGVDAPSKDLKRKTTQGALVSFSGQAVTFVLRTASMLILARLLLPTDFGLVGMVTAFTGFLSLFRDCGLSMAAVQRATITDAQTSTLFWINLMVGGGLAVMAVVLAPPLAAFYREPRLVLVTAALGTSFLFNGASAQHRAVLQRNMRFTALAAIEIVSLVLTTALSIGIAVGGYGYWALVANSVSLPAISSAGVWLVSRWVPGRPLRGTGVRAMLWYGGTVTVNNVIVYLAFNVDKVLLGRFWGTEALGIYGRAYQLLNLPTENLNSTFGLVGFPALSRVQNDPPRVRRCFLKGYGLSLALVMPITVTCALYAEDIIRVFLGARWDEAAPIFRLMAPTILVFAVTNPFAWLMLSRGHATRNLRIASVVAPVVVLSYLSGLKEGPHGVATAFSIAMTLLAVPVIVWAKHGTLISNFDIAKVIAIPFASIIVGAALALSAHGFIVKLHPVFLRLVVECSILFGAYLIVLLFVMKQKPVYIDLLQTTGLWPFSCQTRSV